MKMFYKIHTSIPIVKIKFMPFETRNILKQSQDYISRGFQTWLIRQGFSDKVVLHQYDFQNCESVHQFLIVHTTYNPIF